MLEVHGDLKETADTSILTPSLSSWPVKQPIQEEATEGRGARLPREGRLSRQKPMQSHRRPVASGWGQLSCWDGRRHHTAKDMQGW